MRKVSLILIALCLLNTAVAQDNRPTWTITTPKAGNSTYFYMVERGSGTTINEATNNALLKVMRTTMMRIGAVVSWDEVNRSLQQGTEWGTVAMKYNIPVNKVCEYVERKTDKGYIVAVLCQVARTGNGYPEFDEFSACNTIARNKNVEAALKSALLPGLGQISKDHQLEGWITMGGEALLLGGYIVSYSRGKQCAAVIRSADSPFEYCESADKYPTYRTMNIVFGAAAAALYVFNIYRAYTMVSRDNMEIVLLEPTLMQTGQSWAAGIGVTLKF